MKTILIMISLLIVLTAEALPYRFMAGARFISYHRNIRSMNVVAVSSGYPKVVYPKTCCYPPCYPEIKYLITAWDPVTLGTYRGLVTIHAADY